MNPTVTHIFSSPLLLVHPLTPIPRQFPLPHFGWPTRPSKHSDLQCSYWAAPSDLPEAAMLGFTLCRVFYLPLRIWLQHPVAPPLNPIKAHSNYVGPSSELPPEETLPFLNSLSPSLPRASSYCSHQILRHATSAKPFRCPQATL